MSRSLPPFLVVVLVALAAMPHGAALAQAGTCPVVPLPSSFLLVHAEPGFAGYVRVLPPLRNDGEDQMLLEFYLPSTGTFALGSAANANYATCTQCLLVRLDANTQGFADYFADRGTLTINDAPGTDPLSARLQGVRVIEVTIDPDTFESTPVVNGGCFEFEQTSVFVDGFEG